MNPSGVGNSINPGTVFVQLGTLDVTVSNLSLCHPSYGAVFLPSVVVVARNLFIHPLKGRFGIGSYGARCVFQQNIESQNGLGWEGF